MGTGVETGAMTGEPVLTHKKPMVAGPLAVPLTSDDFDSPTLGLQWQWQANPRSEWLSLTAKPGRLRLFSVPEPTPGNLYDAPNLLMQKFPALEFSATAALAGVTAAQSGLIVFGYDYAWIGVRDGRLVQVTVMNAAEKPAAKETVATEKLDGSVYLRVTVTEGGKRRVRYSPHRK